MSRMPIRALLGGFLLCCLGTVLLVHAATDSPGTAEGSGDMQAEEMHKVMNVLLTGLPCAVKDMAKMNGSVPCVEDKYSQATSDDGSNSGSDESSSNAERKKRHAYAYWWSLTGNSQRIVCPRTDQSNVTQALSDDPRDYPAEAIAQFLIVGRGEAADRLGDPLPSLSALLSSAILPGRSPEIATNVGLEVRACPTELMRLFRYNSTNFGTCWVIQNFEPAIFVNLQCTQRFCSNCQSSYRGWYNLCYPDFQMFNVMSFCPDLPFPVVTDTILVPVGCSCRSVRCRRRWWSYHG